MSQSPKGAEGVRAENHSYTRLFYHSYTRTIFSLARAEVRLGDFCSETSRHSPEAAREAEKRSETKPLLHAKKRGPKKPLFSNHSYTRMFSPQPQFYIATSISGPHQLTPSSSTPSLTTTLHLYSLYSLSSPSSGHLPRPKHPGAYS